MTEIVTIVNMDHASYHTITMKKMSTTTSMVGLAVLVFGALIAAAVIKNNAPSKYDDFAQCLTENGATMYAAYWCPHCQKQEEDFGSAFRFIDRVECSSPGSRSFDLCPDIESTPTWEKADGTRLPGALPFDVLAEEFGCQLPE